MKTAKLVTGILCMVFTIMVLFQSCAAGIVDAIEDSGGTSGAGGALVGFLMLSGGIVQVVTRNSVKNGGSVSAVIIFFLAALIGFSNAGTYADLNIWSAWCVVLGILNVISIFTNKKEKKTED